MEAPLNDAEVRSAIGRVLWEGATLFGVSGDGFYGDTGTVTLEEYLEPGAAYPYNDQPLTVTEYAWADVNGDGQTDCVLHLDDRYYTVLAVQDDTVYAYFFNYADDMVVSPNGSVYFQSYTFWQQVSFYKNQCYKYSVDPPAQWEDFPAERP